MRSQGRLLGQRHGVVDPGSVDGGRRQDHQAADAGGGRRGEGPPDKPDLIVSGGGRGGIAGRQMYEHRDTPEQAGEVRRGDIDAVHGEVAGLGHPGREGHGIESEDAPFGALGKLGHEPPAEGTADAGDGDGRRHTVGVGGLRRGHPLSQAGVWASWLARASSLRKTPVLPAEASQPAHVVGAVGVARRSS